MKFYLLIFSVALVGCPPTPNPPPNDADAAPVSYVGDASIASLRCCGNLSQLGCVEGKHPNCGERVELILSDKLAPFDVNCCAGAGTKVIVRACSPSIKCE